MFWLLASGAQKFILVCRISGRALIALRLPLLLGIFPGKSAKALLSVGFFKSLQLPN
jgi:hypothetical protein